MKKLQLIFFCFSSVFCGFSQTNEIDSLKQIVTTNVVHDTIKIASYLSLAKNYLSRDLDSFSLYTNKAMKLSLENKRYRLGNIYNGIGLNHFYNSNIDSARYYYDKALKIVDVKEDKETRAVIYGNYSMSYLTTSDFDKKIAYNLKAINLMKDNNYVVCRYYYNHATMYGSIAGFSEQSKKYLRLAYLSSKKSNNYRVQGVSLSGLVYFNIEEEKFDSARINLEKGLLLCEKTKSPQICFEINRELGKLYDNKKLFDKANFILLEAEKYAVIRKRKYDIMHINLYLGENEFNRKNYLRSTIYFQKAEDIFIEEPVPEIGLELYKKWAEAEKKKGNYKKSTTLLERYFVIKDSIFSQENREVLANADAKYEAEKKDKELIQQQLQIEQKDIEIQKKKAQYNYMAGIAIFLSIATILTWFLYKQWQKKKNQEILTLKRDHQIKTLETLIEGEEKERLRIAKELHDGVNGDLSAIKFKLSSLLEMNNTVVKEAVEMIDKSCMQVRAISHNLVPPSLESFSLIEAAETFCQNSNTIHEAQITFHHIGKIFKISKKDEINLFRIIQELVTNSLKHAEATEVNAQISSRGNIIHITVEDNGKGFSPANVKNEGIGLKNIQSRIDYLNASMDIISNTQGTSTTIEIDTDKLHEN